VSPGKYWDSILKLGHGCFLPYPFQFIIHCHPFSRCCIIRVSEIASLNKLQRNKQKRTRFTKIIQRAYGKHAILRWSTHIFSYYRRVFDDIIETGSSWNTVWNSAGVALLWRGLIQSKFSSRNYK
jgi:hypothetical protein